MALKFSNAMPVGTVAPPFSLPATDGQTYSLESFAEAKALVVVFTCNHCPYAKASEDRLIALAREFAPRGVRFVAINSNDARAYPEDSFACMVERATEKQYPFPYLFDESQEVARAYDAACTPDIFVFDARRHLKYNGRIDDNWKDPSQVTRRDLRMAIEAVLAGRPIDFEVALSMGCSIKWRRPE